MAVNIPLNTLDLNSYARQAWNSKVMDRLAPGSHMHRWFNYLFDTQPMQPWVTTRVKRWNRRSPKELKNLSARRLMMINSRRKRSITMQRQFTIELRVDYEDKDKHDVMRKAVAAAARHVYATALLVKDQVTPQIAVFSDDFFQGHDDIKLMSDVIAEGIEQIEETSGEGSGVSQEMMEAMK